MPTCAKCGNNFPNRMLIDGKHRQLSSRKRCLNCSPFGLHNTSPILKKYYNVVKNEKICKRCNNVFITKGQYCNACTTSRRRIKLKKLAIDYKGSKCLECGYNKTYTALTFHHRNPDDKLFTISGNLCRSWNVIKTELDKCDLLCMNCHAELEETLRNNKRLYD